jgi:molybdopterin-containing oxidoreductase family membrane subunit
MAGRRALVGIFSYLDDVLDAIGQLKEAHHPIETVFSPTPRHEIDDALAVNPSPVRYFALLGGILGIVGGLSLAVYTGLQWKFIVSGKPVLAWIPFVVIAFEFCILLGVVGNLTGLLVSSRMPRVRLPSHYDPRFTEDRFGILVSFREAEEEKVSRLLREAGAEEVREVFT